MANPYAAQAKSGSASKMKSLTGKKSGGAVYAGESSTKPAYASGGKVQEFNVGGAVSTPSFARGGRSKGKGKHKGTHINIAVVAPHGKGSDPAASMPPEMPPQAPMAPPPGMGPPGAGAPPGMPPGPGMPPMKRGGAAYAKGGKVPMKAGAGTGEGRLEKIKAYGKKA